jgi:hypothetical protein
MDYQTLADILQTQYGDEYNWSEAKSWLEPMPTYLQNIPFLKIPFPELEKIKDAILKAPLDEMPLLINEEVVSARIIAKWRLSIGK